MYTGRSVTHCNATLNPREENSARTEVLYNKGSQSGDLVSMEDPERVLASKRQIIHSRYFYLFLIFF